MEFAVAAWVVEGEPSPSYVGSAEEIRVGEPSPSYVGSAEEIRVRSLHGLCKTFSGQKKRSGLQTAWDSSKVIYKVASWTATAIRLFSSCCIGLHFDVRRQFEPVVSELTLVLSGERSGGFLSIMRTMTSSSACLSRCSKFLREREIIVEESVLFSRRSFHATGSSYIRERDYYEILGIPKDAAVEDIKKAFHNLAKKYHPDANKNSPAAKRKFQEIREAYETLQDPGKRAQYDMEFSRTESVSYDGEDAAQYHETHHDPFSATFYKFFSEVFENEREIYAPNIQVELNLSFHEAAKGCTKQVCFSAQVPCTSCFGKGYPKNANLFICAACKGTGRVTVFPFTSTCVSCKGYGKIIKDHCTACNGFGVVEGLKSINVTIPAGVNSGDTIKVPKAGNQGKRGVLLEIFISSFRLSEEPLVAKDPVFHRDDADIYVDANISFTQAILGGKAEVPTLSGKMHIKIPMGVQPGQLLALRGRGLPKHIGSSSHGDQFVRFRVHFPSVVNERQREILEEFAKEEIVQERIRFTDRSWWQELVDYFNGPRIMAGIAFLLLLHLLLTRSVS
ncbi:hypothetical protein HPP92_003828 [Vanilla planifolia]|uniref:Chaperone protein dnaJ 1, mitochondrial n=1 Tax=Vanilla planifolia TaxID=51239 RepID=A0A835VP09_VANPL|nr:hypothetical protein HPP92_003828 [Vanilla planifolia]